MAHELDNICAAIIRTVGALACDYSEAFLIFGDIEKRLNRGEDAQTLLQSNAETIVRSLCQITESIVEKQAASRRINGQAAALDLDKKFIRDALEFLQDQQMEWSIPNLRQLESAVEVMDTPAVKQLTPQKSSRTPTRVISSADAMSRWELERDDDPTLAAVEKELRAKRYTQEILQLGEQIGQRGRA